jgi:hypothetical protein
MNTPNITVDDILELDDDDATPLLREVIAAAVEPFNGDMPTRASDALRALYPDAKRELRIIEVVAETPWCDKTRARDGWWTGGRYLARTAADACLLHCCTEVLRRRLLKPAPFCPYGKGMHHETCDCRGEGGSR